MNFSPKSEACLVMVFDKTFNIRIKYLSATAFFAQNRESCHIESYVQMRKCCRNYYLEG